VWSIKPCDEEDTLYASHKIGCDKEVKQYNSTDITYTYYLGTAYYKNENTVEPRFIVFQGVGENKRMREND